MDTNAKVAELEKQLSEAQKEVLVLRNAVAYLASRLDCIPDLSGPVGGSVRISKKPSRPSLTGASTPGSGPAANVSVSRPVTAAGAAGMRTPVKDEKRPSTGAKGSSGKKHSSGGTLKNKITTVREPEIKDVPTSQSFDKTRQGKYNVGNKQIFFHVPSYMPPVAELPAPAEASTSLTLDYIYGYNGKAGRNNLFFSKANPGHLIYSMAGTGVVFDYANNSQKFFTGHNEDILSLTVHPSRPIVATGQLDPKGAGTPFICLWDSTTGDLVKQITYHDRGIVALGFSGDGKYLVSIGNDDSHTVAVWDWESVGGGKKTKAGFAPLIEQMSSKDEIFGLEVNPKIDEKGDTLEFATYGVKHLKIWKAAGLTNADKKARKMESKIPATYQATKVIQKSFHSVAFLPNSDDYVVGTETGDIYRLTGPAMSKFWKAHDKTVGVVTATANGYLSAGEDGKIIFWDNDNKVIDTIELVGKIKPRAVALADDVLCVGLKNNGIVEIDRKTKEHKVIMNGHHDELWGLATHPSQPFVASGGHDKAVRIMDYKQRTQVRVLPVKSEARSIAFTSDGKYLAVGQWNGSVTLFSFNDGKEMFDIKLGPETVDSVQFSPDNTLLACGSWDQKVHILSVPDGKKKHTLKGHTSSVLMLNFSTDGKYMMTNSRDYEILYWDINEGKRADLTQQIIDTQWYGWNCFLGWPVQGIWAGAGDGTDINAVDRSHNEIVLAAGDDFGKVRLYAYPAAHKLTPVKEYPGHSSFVTNVRFSNDDSMLFSAGGNDCGLFQWVHA